MGDEIKFKNAFLYFPGLPQMIDKKFFIDKVDDNSIFFSVNYLGSFLSGGKFTPENCKKTVELAIEFIKNRESKKTFDGKNISWSYDNLYLLGYSFAGNTILTSKILSNDVKSIFLFAPLLFLNKSNLKEYIKKDKLIKNFYKFNLFYLKFLRRGYGFVLKGIEKDIWDKYFLGNDTKSIIRVKDNFPNVFIFHGKQDKEINYSSSIFFSKQRYRDTEVILIDKVGHNLEKLFLMKKIIRLIQK
jgi:hypothetical protein